MARDCIRQPRHVIQPLVIGRQPDLFDGPTVTHEPAQADPAHMEPGFPSLPPGHRLEPRLRTPSMTDYSKPVRVPMPVWTDEELRTLVDFRRRNGRRWKSKLLDLYLFGKDDSEPNGAGLRHIRNRQGPSRVDALSKATLDEAEERLAPSADGLA